MPLPTAHSAPVPVRTTTLPGITHHKSSGKARVRLSGADVYLGTWGSPGVQAAYERAIALWLNAGRTWPPPNRQHASVGTLRVAYSAHAQGYYVKSGRPTSRAATIETVLELAETFLTPGRPLDTITPRELSMFRAWLASHPRQRWSRRTINEYVGLLTAAIGWMATDGPITEHDRREVAAAWHVLRAMKPLKKGRSPAVGVPAPSEPTPRGAACPKAVETVLPHMHATLAAMVRVQLLTGMRPGELVAMEPRYLSRTKTPDVWCYTVPPHANKTDHAGRERRVMLGPRALEVLRPFLQGRPESSPVFSAREAALQVEQERRATATVYVSPANRPDARAARRAAERGKPRGRAPQARYTVCAYGRALRRACERAELPKEKWFSPHQLRHLRATQVANLMDVHVAQKVLGHASITTTMLYVHTHDEAAVRAAREHG